MLTTSSTGNKKRWQKVVVFALITALMIMNTGQLTFAAGGDFSLNFAASAPLSYSHVTGGGTWGDGTKDYVVESLESGFFYSGNIVSFLTRIAVDPAATEIQTIQLDYAFSADTTGSSGAAFSDIVSVELPAGDTGMTGTATVNLIPESEVIDGAIFTSGSVLKGSVIVGDLDPGEVIIVRINVRVLYQEGANPTGNLQASILSAAVTAPTPDAIPVGNQTVPFKIGNALLVVEKSSTTTLIDHAGQVVPYTFIVTNNGDIPLTGITVTDPNIPPPGPVYQSGDTSNPGILDPDESWTYTGSHTVTQDEFISLGGGDSDLDNTVSANSIEIGPATDSLAIPITPTPAIHVVKSSTTTSITTAGQIVDYTFVVTNVGNIVLTGITVTDPMCNVGPTYDSGDTNSDGKLDLTEAWTYIGSHTVTQAEINAGGNLSNTVTADSNESGPDTDSLDIPIIQNPALNIVKSSTTTEIDHAGQVVPYTFTVTNTGNVTLTGITVTDTKCDATPVYQSGDTNDDSMLQKSETWIFTGSHTVTQAEIDAGGNLHNTATADSNETGPDTDSHDIPITRNPQINVVKSSTTTSITAAGQVIPYIFTVTNTGNVTLTGITVTDPNVSPAPAYQSGDTNADNKLDLTETWIYTGNHTVTQAEIDTNGGGDGDLDNTVTADSNETGPDTDDHAIPITRTPEIHVVKTSTTEHIDTAEQVVTYTFTVTNTGNMTLTNITVTDPNVSPAPAYVSGDTNTNNKLETTETWIYTGYHTVTQAEIDSNGGGDGYLDNTVTADSDESAPDTDDFYIPIITGPALQVVKSSTTTSITTAGQVVPYTFVVTNIGNMTLTGITVVDHNCDAAPVYVSGDSNTNGKLEITETWTYSGQHTVTQAEIDSNGGGDGYLNNLVTADSVESESDTDVHAIPIAINAGLNVDKSSTTTLITAAGQVVPYTFIVTNTGNVTLTGITVTDPMCTVGPAYVSGDTNGDSKLDLTETWTYSGSHTVTQAEIDAGGNLHNMVTADSNQTGPDTDSLDIPISQTPALNVEKSSTTTLITAAGQVVPYTFIVTNTGNMTLTGITVTDPMCTVGPAYVSGDTNGNSKLELSETWTFSGSHTVTQAEIDAGGNLHNMVTADSNQTGPDTDTLDIPISQNPMINVEKSSSTTSITAAGQVVPYTFLVTNTGNMTLTGITVTDPMCDAAPLYVSGDANGNSKLETTETWTFTGQHTVTQAEINAGGNLHNTVTADSSESSPDTDSLDIPISQVPGINVEKSSTTTLITAAGQVVPYTFVVTNTGNMSLTGITVNDPMCTVGPSYVSGDIGLDGILELTEVWTYSGSHTVTQAEIDAEVDLHNTVTADSNQTGPDTDSLDIPIDYNPLLTITKTGTFGAGPDGYADPGEIITYSFTVTNIGNVTLTNVTITDPLPGLSAITLSSTTIPVGGSITGTATYAVTQADIDAGSVYNLATADSDESPPDDGDNTEPLPQNPLINIVKSSTTTAVIAAGQIVPYTFIVTNVGNETLTGITVTDPMLDAPAVLISGDTNLDNKLDLTETWTFTGSHTVTLAEYLEAAGLNPLLTNIVTADSNESPPDIDVYNVPYTKNPAINVVKSSTTTEINTINQTVPYTFTVTNVGDMVLTGITVVDPTLSSGPTYVSGDTDGDGALDLTETWIYTGIRIVPQSELESNGGGDGLIDNTVTVDSIESGPDTDSHSIPINLYVQPTTTPTITVAGATFTVSPELVVYGAEFETGDNSYAFGVIGFTLLLLAGSLLALWFKRKREKTA